MARYDTAYVISALITRLANEAYSRHREDEAVLPDVDLGEGELSKIIAP